MLPLIPVVLQDFKAIDIKKANNSGALCAAMEFILCYTGKQIGTKFNLWVQNFIVTFNQGAFTFGASDWLIFSTNHVNVRLYMALARASRDDTACSKLSGLTICKCRENRSKVPVYKEELQVHEQEEGRVTSSPLAVSFLCVSASPRAQPSTASSCKTTTHLFSAVAPRKIGHIFENQGRLADLFWPLQDCLSGALWWYKFLLPRLRQTERFPDGEYWRWYSANSEVRHRGNIKHFVEKL